jgi:iron-sulfur cluster assembly protein
METINKAPVIFTRRAIEEVKKLMAKEQVEDDRCLRVGVKGGGCSGMSYLLHFDVKTDKDDYFEIDGVPCIINPAHNIYLAGMEINFEDGLNSRGFVFNNPNASTTCGCGTSFAV